MRDRPELASAEYQIQAAFIRRRQARLRPFVPSVFFTYAGGGLGGGLNAFFGNFGARGDAEVGLFWELQNLGFTDFAIMRRRAAELNIANLEKYRTQTRVGADVVASFETRQAAARQIEDARETLVEALDSLRLNFLNIRQAPSLPRATRPIEVLQPIQALAQGRLDYLDSVLSYNRPQFQLKLARSARHPERTIPRPEMALPWYNGSMETPRSRMTRGTPHARCRNITGLHRRARHEHTT